MDFHFYSVYFKAFALTGRIADCHYTQGIALGFCGSQNKAPCKGKSFKNPDNLQSFCPFRACWVISIIQEGELGNINHTGGCAG